MGDGVSFLLGQRFSFLIVVCKFDGHHSDILRNFQKRIDPIRVKMLPLPFRDAGFCR
jgi:hypothetical protein